MRIEPQKIMCAVDFSDFTPVTISHGIAMAREFGAELIICHIVPSHAIHFSYSHYHINVDEIERIDQEQISRAEEHIREMISSYDFPMEILIKSGHAADGISRAALENQVDIVIAATHGLSGIKRFLIGSVTERLVQVLHCPLLVLNSGEGDADPGAADRFQLNKILVGCDFSPDSQLAFDYSLSLAQEFQAELHLVHVLKPSEPFEDEAGDVMLFHTGDLLRWQQADLSAPAGDLQEKKNLLFRRFERRLQNMVPEDCRNWCTPVTALLEGEPYRELIRYAETQKMDMIVLGIRGHSLLEQFLVGSTTDRVLRRSVSSVLAVRGENS